jgi:hypothetical protein
MSAGGEMAPQKEVHRSAVAVGTVNQTIGRHTKQIVRDVADAVLIVVLVAFLGIGTWFLL